LPVVPPAFCATVTTWLARDCAIVTTSVPKQRRSSPAKMRAGLCSCAIDSRECDLRSGPDEKRFVLDDILRVTPVGGGRPVERQLERRVNIGRQRVSNCRQSVMALSTARSVRSPNQGLLLQLHGLYGNYSNGSYVICTMDKALFAGIVPMAKGTIASTTK